MIVLRRHIIGLLALSAAAVAMPAQAAPSSFQASGPSVRAFAYGQYAQNIISPSQAKAIAARYVRAAEYVDLERIGGKYIVRMRRKNGRIVDVFIDAATGRVLN